MNTQQQNIFFADVHNMRAIVLRKPRMGTVSPANMAQQVMLVVALFILVFFFHYDSKLAERVSPRGQIKCSIITV